MFNIMQRIKRLISPQNREAVSLEACSELKNSWQDQNIPQRQFDLCVQKELADFRQGKEIKVYDTLVAILKENIPLSKKTLLEVGCSSGYYSAVLKLSNLPFEYHGCDFSSAFVAFAKKLYPNTPFDQEDACSLSYKTNSFDIVVSGCCLLHIKEYAQAISETVRVAHEYVIFHRTPVVSLGPTHSFIKTAYGVEMFEIHFSERELLRLFAKQGLQLLDAITLDAYYDPAQKDIQSCKTYLCKKNAR